MTSDVGTLFQVGSGVGAVVVGLWSRLEAKHAKDAARGAKNQTDQIKAAVQPNGESIAQIAKTNTEILTELRNLTKANNRGLIQLIAYYRYQRRRNHAIINGLYRIALGNSTILRHLGIDVPDPVPPTPDEFRTPEQEGPLDELH